MINTEYKYSEPQHGDIVEIWDQDTHEVRFVCPRCCTLMTHIYSAVIDGAICPDCWQVFDVIWHNKTQDVEITINRQENTI
jgi:hypothetical protein